MSKKVKFKDCHLLYDDVKGTVIENKKLTHQEVWRIVNEWYTLGMYKDILQDENGLDLEEICEQHIY